MTSKTISHYKIHEKRGEGPCPADRGLIPPGGASCAEQPFPELMAWEGSWQDAAPTT